MLLKPLFLNHAWFVPEKYSDKALKLMEQYSNGALEIIAPTLICYEVANALRFHPYYRLSQKELLKAIAALRDMQIAVEPTTKIWSKAFEMTVLNGISVYDAIYLATSMSFNTKLFTSDEGLIEKLSDSIKENVFLLRDVTF